MSYLRKQFCDRAEVKLCKAQSRNLCADYAVCFGPEDGNYSVRCRTAFYLCRPRPAVTLYCVRICPRGIRRIHEINSIAANSVPPKPTKTLSMGGPLRITKEYASTTTKVIRFSLKF